MTWPDSSGFINQDKSNLVSLDASKPVYRFLHRSLLSKLPSFEYFQELSSIAVLVDGILLNIGHCPLMTPRVQCSSPRYSFSSLVASSRKLLTPSTLFWAKPLTTVPYFTRLLLHPQLTLCKIVRSFSLRLTLISMSCMELQKSDTKVFRNASKYGFLKCIIPDLRLFLCSMICKSALQPGCFGNSFCCLLVPEMTFLVLRVGSDWPHFTYSQVIALYKAQILLQVNTEVVFGTDNNPFL